MHACIDNLWVLAVYCPPGHYSAVALLRWRNVWLGIAFLRNGRGMACNTFIVPGKAFVAREMLRVSFSLEARKKKEAPTTFAVREKTF